jgi:hypothetical protein
MLDFLCFVCVSYTINITGSVLLVKAIDKDYLFQPTETSNSSISQSTPVSSIEF